MSHFAKVENGIVTEVIVAEQDHIDTLEGTWIQTSYNTHGGQHPEDNPLRGNYASKGFIYDAENDVFYEPQVYPSWTLNETTWQWECPKPYPTITVEAGTENSYTWDEPTLSWKEIK
jgi:hypothetical protein